MNTYTLKLDDKSEDSILITIFPNGQVHLHHQDAETRGALNGTFSITTGGKPIGEITFDDGVPGEFIRIAPVEGTGVWVKINATDTVVLPDGFNLPEGPYNVIDVQSGEIFGHFIMNPNGPDTFKSLLSPRPSVSVTIDDGRGPHVPDWRDG